MVSTWYYLAVGVASLDPADENSTIRVPFPGDEMIRIAKMTDYAIVLMSHAAQHGADESFTARDLASASRLPLPTTSKILKALARSGLMISRRGVAGGYALARMPGVISVADIIEAIEGPIGVTECSRPVTCDMESHCPVRPNWQRINMAVRQALEGLTLAQMAHPLPAAWGTSPAARVEGLDGADVRST